MAGAAMTGHVTALCVERQLATGRRFMVAAKHPWAAQAGLDALERGGNAIDAAVTAAFAIGVVEPWMSGLGAGGFMTVQPAAGAPVVIDYFGRGPRAARPDLYELIEEVASDGVGYTGVAGDANANGVRSVAVPGVVAGLTLALERFGTIDLDQALAPAIAFATSGFELGWYQSLVIATGARRLRADPEAARIFLIDGVPPTATFGGAGPSLRQPELADTLRRIAADGPSAFYRGELAERIVAHVRSGGGILSSADLAEYQALLVDPLRIGYREVELVLLPHAAGGITVAEALQILDGFDLAARGFNTATSLHLLAEASRRAFADRHAYVGDPDFCDTDWERLASAVYAAERRAEIDPARASAPAPGVGLSMRVPTALTVPTATGGCTTHLSVVDAEGTMVSLTQTLTELFGAGTVVPGTGIVLNDTMSLFDPRPGGVNQIDARKRPASSMAHVIAVRKGQPVLAVGANGGRRIMDTCLQMVTDTVDYGLDIQSACAAPLIDCSGPELLADDRLPAGTRERLRAMGHPVRDVSVSFWPQHFGLPTGVAVDPATGLRYGGAVPFAMGVAIGR
jgi:gamma-glutamyltranspeptidase/glutathione hydrolase